jgi:hypothetical protein
VYEKSWKVSSPALMPATSLATGDTYRTGPRADSPPNRRYHFAQRAGTPEGCPGPVRLEQPQQQYYQDDYYYDAYYQAQLIAPHPFTSFTVVGCSLSPYRRLDASTRSPTSPYPCRSHRSIHRQVASWIRSSVPAPPRPRTPRRRLRCCSRGAPRQPLCPRDARRPSGLPSPVW